MKKALLTASLMLVVTTTAACGGGSGGWSDSAPTDASKKEFCAVITGADNNITGKDLAKQLDKVGTPKTVSKDERKGFEVFVKKIGALGSKPSDSELSQMEKDLSADDLKAVTAFITYVSTECLPS